MIVVAGESLIDLAVRPDGEISATPGGGPFNVARALGRLGVPVAFLGRLSTDVFGRRLRDALAADGVDLSLTTTTDDPTLLAVAEIGAAGTASYRFHTAETAAVGLRAGAWLPAGTTALHVGTLGLVLEPMATAIVDLALAVPSDVLVMADPNCRPAAIVDGVAYRARLARLLPRVDVLKVSTDDLAWLDPDHDPIEACRRLIAAGEVVALVTDGGRPVRIVTADDVTEIAVPAVTIVDTIGAGDAFGAGFLAAWTDADLRRSDLVDLAAVSLATAFAVRVGAWTVTQGGADPPTRADLRDVMSG